MRPLKPVLVVAVALGLWALWANRSVVVDAYDGEARSPVPVAFGGLEPVEPTDLGPSPYLIPSSPDTRSVPVALSFDDGRGDEPPPPRPPPVIPLTGGGGRLSGVVTGPSGSPVPFATVRVERHTPDGSALRDVQAGADGRWSITHLLGGRYRIRAWSLSGQEPTPPPPPALGPIAGLVVGEPVATVGPQRWRPTTAGWTMTQSSLHFLPADEALTVDLVLRRVDNQPRIEFVTGGDIYLGLTGTVAASVVWESIDADGLIVLSGISGVDLSLSVVPGGESIVSVSPPSARTDGDGAARFTLRCNRLGSSQAWISADFSYVPAREVTLPACVPIPPPPEPEVDPSAEPAPGDPGAAPATPDPAGANPTGEADG